MLLLTQFLLRLAFGMAAGMAIVSPRQVTSGYFRNHLYVTLGLTALAALLCRALENVAFWPSVAAALASYLGAVAWLYESPRAGKAALALVAAAALLGALLVDGVTTDATMVNALRAANVVLSGSVLGVVMAAMLLGHWYLNAPGMQLAPLRRLLGAAAVVVALHALVCIVGLVLELQRHGTSTQWQLFLALRWSFGLAGVFILIWMAWRTLEVPNTQSATGILYVAVIGTFVGETTALLLSAESQFPV
jgi:hypothetical protein